MATLSRRLPLLAACLALAGTGCYALCDDLYWQAKVEPSGQTVAQSSCGQTLTLGATTYETGQTQLQLQHERLLVSLALTHSVDYRSLELLIPLDLPDGRHSFSYRAGAPGAGSSGMTAMMTHYKQLRSMEGAVTFSRTRNLPYGDLPKDRLKEGDRYESTVTLEDLQATFEWVEPESLDRGCGQVETMDVGPLTAKVTAHTTVNTCYYGPRAPRIAH